jgi:hypothetical protein
MPLRSTLLLPLCLLAAFFSSAGVMTTHAETFRNPRRVPLPVDPYGVTTGDLNGDGLGDIVWTELPPYPGTAMLHVLLAGAGGQYTSAPDLSLPFAPASLQCIIEDVTGDKRNDLVCVGVANNFTNVYLVTYPGNGDGTFAAPVQTGVTAQVLYSNPIIARSGDLNGDGLTDLIVMQAFYSGVLPYFSDGTGGFTQGQQFQGSFNFSVPTVTDLNGDGKLDVLWPTGPGVDLGHGDGTFSNIVHYDPGYDSNCAFGDVDGDGHLDAACTWYDQGDLDGQIHLTVLRGNADGSFASTPLFTRTFGTQENEADGLGTILSPVFVADINGDGYADIVSLSGDGYCVLLGGPGTTWNGQPEEFVAASWQSEGGLPGIYGVSIADMNGDGLPDIVAVGPNGLYITYAQHDGTLSSAPAPEVGQVSTSVTLADFNGDGNLDAVSAGDTALELSLGRGDGTFQPYQPVTTTDNFGDALYAEGKVISGDFNGDGKQDLIATGNVAVYTTQNYILFGHGDGTFATPQPISISLGKVADLNQDGLSDVYSVQNGAAATNTLTVSLSKGDGTFTTVSTNLPTENPNGYTVPSVGPAFADYRHSGRLDAAVAAFNNAYLLRSHGDGTFDSTGTTLALPGLPNLDKLGAYDVASGDFDGDGNPDIAVLVQYGSGIYDLSTPTSAVWVFYGNGDGTFSTAVLACTFNRHAQALGAGDLNDDGLADLVLTSYSVYQDNGVLIVHALPNRTWGPEVDYTGGDGLSPFWIADINHDGRNDLIFSESQRGNDAASSISVLLNEPDNVVTGMLAATPEPSFVNYPFAVQAIFTPPTAGASLTGNVTFSLDGSVVGAAPLSGNSATVNLPGTGVALGSHTLSASWPGDSSNPGLTLSGTHNVVLVPVHVSMASSANPSAVGQSVSFSVQVQAAVPPGLAAPTAPFTGALSLYDGTVLLGTQTSVSGAYTFLVPALASGVHAIRASYVGDAVYAAGQGTLSQTVDGLPVSMHLTASANPAVVGSTVNLTAQIVSSGSCPGCAFSAPVQFSDVGTPLGSAPVNASGVAILPVSFTTVGAHALTASYPGDSNYDAASATLNEQVVRADTTLTLTRSASPVTAGTPVSFTAHLASSVTTSQFAGDAIVFDDGTNLLGSVAADGTGTAVLTTANLPVGTHTITATLAQTALLNGSSALVSEVITPASTSIALSASPNPVYQNSPLTLNVLLTTPASFPASGTVQFLDGGTVLATPAIGADAATFITSSLAPGQHTLTAVFGGDASNLPASSAPLVVTVLASDFVLTSTPAAISVKTEHHLTFTLAAASVGAFHDQLDLSSAVLPDHMTLRFGAPKINLVSGGTGSVSVYMDTDDVLGYASAAPPARPGKHAPPALWAFIPASFLLLFLRRRGMRLAGVWAVLLALALVPLSGCSSLYPKSVAPGAYTIQIHASGGTTGLAHTLNIEVAVMP